MRDDMSKLLIHFTKGDDEEDAYKNFKNIISQGMLCSSREKIRSGANCVCFTEAPLPALADGLLNPSFYSNYSAFGFALTKQHVFELGGRPVIYQPDCEFEQLSNENSWRHVRYEPPDIDFTWEREWRVQTCGFTISPETTKLVVPNASWAQRLVNEHRDEQEWCTIQYYQIMDSLLAQQYEEPWPWIVVELGT
ncbi:hypothetical protein [Enterovibrio baiacu]|uniref:hypothetical protein n=1 Tax=Enterovibrio baiacu TaxID=2491023 RepID=UPI0010129F9A|nr:hypothetical protein [Enterovibrio baiacu]MBE1277864.1 hypothetical protein [Enterovibrio baiacu]